MTSSVLEEMRTDIETFGWHCLSVAPREGEEGGNFSYTVGLMHSFSHPELIMFGLDSRTMHGVLTECVDKINESGALPIDEPIPEILASDYDVILREVEPSHFDEYFGMALNFYGGPVFRALVVFWPDKNGQFPWESSLSLGQEEALAIVRKGIH